MITLLLLAAFTATFVTIDASSGCVESKLIKGNTVKGRFTLTDTIEECLEHCRQVDGCVAINYNTKKRCNPKKRLLKDTDQTNSLWTYCPIDEPEPEIQVLPVEPEPEIQVLPPAPGFTLISEESRGICTSCPHLGGGAVTGCVEGCKKLCRDTANCNAFNYKNNVCYTKKCAADCDIKPTTSQGGWNVWLANELNCEPIEDKDPCKPDPCQNGGTCADGKCSCPDGFEGDNCETEAKKDPSKEGGLLADRVIDWTTASSTGYWLPASTVWRKSYCPLLAESYTNLQKGCRGACERMPECNVINYCPPQGSSYYGHANNKSPCVDAGLSGKCELRTCKTLTDAGFQFDKNWTGRDKSQYFSVEFDLLKDG